MLLELRAITFKNVQVWSDRKFEKIRKKGGSKPKLCMEGGGSETKRIKEGGLA